MSEVCTQQHVELVRAAAQRGVCEAQAIYAQMLLDGVLVPADPAYAFHLFERAAVGGHLESINMVGRCLDQGWGVPASPSLAERWFRKAAERGHDWGMYNLATLLILGRGIKQDRLQALHWLREAAQLGHAKSINLLGGFYEDGWEVARDFTRARECYRISAVRGDFRGQFNYARMLAADGDIRGAIYWLKQVPATATPAFISKMKAFLSHSTVDALRNFAGQLTVTA